MGDEPNAGTNLVADARSRGLSFGVCSGRLWVHISAEHLELAHLAMTMLLHEDEVLAALSAESDGPRSDQHGGDHDQPFLFGSPPPFDPQVLTRLERLRSRQASRPPDGERPAGD